MAYTKNIKIWAEMARRKVQFHNDEKWNHINLWGLFNYGTVKRMLDSGLLKTGMRKENEIIWVQPSKEAWEKHIKPLIEKYNLEKLQFLAGW